MAISLRVFLAALLFAYPAIQIYFGRRGSSDAPKTGYSRPDRQTVKREGRALLATQAVAFFGIVGCVVIEVVHPRSLQVFDVSIPTWVRWLAVGITALSLWGLIAVHLELGRFWSAYLELRCDHQLIESGPYRWVRHPMYTVLIVHAVGLGIVAANSLLLAFGVLRAMMFLIKVPREESMLIARFGDQYREYAKCRGVLFPRLPPLR